MPGKFPYYGINSLFIWVTSLIGVIVYTIEGRSLAGILTPTMREFWRAYIEKARETTSTIDTPYIEASYDPYTNPLLSPYTSPLPKPLLPPI